MSLEKQLVNIIKQIHDEKRLGDKRVEQLYNLIFGGQITFPPTQNPSADVNTLDDYEEGTWIPDLQFGQAKVGITYHTQTGMYTKIGNCVFLSCYIRLSSKGSSNGDAEIYGLPFATGATLYAVALRLDGVSYANSPQGYTGVGANYLILEEITEVGVRLTLTDANFTDTSRIVATLAYQV